MSVGFPSVCGEAFGFVGSRLIFGHLSRDRIEVRWCACVVQQSHIHQRQRHFLRSYWDRSRNQVVHLERAFDDDQRRIVETMLQRLAQAIHDAIRLGTFWKFVPRPTRFRIVIFARPASQISDGIRIRWLRPTQSQN